MQATPDKPARLDDPLDASRWRAQMPPGGAASDTTVRLHDEADEHRLRALMPLGRAASLLDCHVATIYRWTGRGCRGVRLRYVQRGATRCTTRAWLEDFFERLTRAGQPVPPGVEAPDGFDPPRDRERHRNSDGQAGRALDRIWGRSPGRRTTREKGGPSNV